MDNIDEKYHIPILTEVEIDHLNNLLSVNEIEICY